ncbi:caspase family protein [Pseudotabrizicola sp. L79]|uniref:caspase family protein n=1 Tax=Pseudotabrizicola sp. L79 TaxID=3118402 RepID=UPI002F93A8A1
MIAVPLALSAPMVRAETGAGQVRAVLVGVGDYLHLDADLQGPPADVVLMAETLMARGVPATAITALTSGAALPAGVVQAAPVRADILAALKAVSAASQPGDTVVFYFSGHGSQAPDANGDEGGGYDEILLPADADAWKGQVGAVQNALIDDELAAWAQPMLARGVKVVGIIDACHSATGFRAVGGAGVARWVPPTALGLPEEDISDAPAGMAEPMEGEFVFLYSSQSDQRSFEYPSADGAVWHGEFTLRLTEVLREVPEASWAQVLAAVTDRMAQGATRQQPEAEGPMLSAPVFGEGQLAARMAVQSGKVQAGFLAGVAVGAELAFYADAAGGEALGTAIVTRAEARVAEVEALPEGAAWAELAVPAPPLPLQLGTPLRAQADDGFDYALWLAALPPPVAQPDLVPILADGGVALAGPDAVLDPEGPGSSPRIRPEPGETEAEAVARVLAQVGYGLRLRQLLLAGGGKARTLTARPVLEVALEKRPADLVEEDCSTAGPAVAFEGDAARCDQLWLEVKNTSGKDQDVSVLYLAGDYTVQAIWPSRGLSNRLAHGETLRTGLQIAPDSPPAIEELWVLAVPATEDGPRTDLTQLATPTATRAVATGAGAPLMQWMDRQLADDGEGTRGFAPKPTPFNLIRKTVRIRPEN